MNAREIAEKILELVKEDYLHSPPYTSTVKKEIESLLKDALAGAFCHECGKMGGMVVRHGICELKDARAAAFEEACEIITNHKYREFTDEERHGACGGFCQHGCFVDDHECRKCLCEAIRSRAKDTK